MPSTASAGGCPSGLLQRCPPERQQSQTNHDVHVVPVVDGHKPEQAPESRQLQGIGAELLLGSSSTSSTRSISVVVISSVGVLVERDSSGW